MNPVIFHNEWNWKPKMASYLRFPFDGLESIKNNYSQAFQDIFLLMVLGGKRCGRYLEIGGHVPINNNNTNLITDDFDWSGLSIELDPSHYSNWRKFRPNSNFLIADALAIDYDKALNLYFEQDGGRIDYLQLDIDPSINTLNVLKALPLNKWRFSVITFETDAYLNDFRARDESRKILFEQGYELIAKDVSVLFSPVSDSPIPFEDWWVDPQVISKDIIDEIQVHSMHNSLPQNLIFCNKSELS
jgi:hypothetical protein